MYAADASLALEESEEEFFEGPACRCGCTDIVSLSAGSTVQELCPRCGRNKAWVIHRN